MFKKLKQSRKGFTLKELAPVAVSFVAVAIALGLGLNILSQMGTDQCATGYTWNETTTTCVNSTGAWVSGAGETYASNITRYGLSSGDELASWLPTIALIVAAAVIIGVITVYLAGKFR